MAKYRPWAGARIWPIYRYLGHIRGRPIYRGYRLFTGIWACIGDMGLCTGDIGYIGIYGVQAYIQGRPVYGIYRCTGYIPLYRLCRLYRPIYRCTGLYTAMQAIPAIQAIRPRLHTPYIPCTGLCTLYGVYRLYTGVYTGIGPQPWILEGSSTNQRILERMTDLSPRAGACARPRARIMRARVYTGGRTRARDM